MTAPAYVRLLTWPQLVVVQFMLTLKNRRWLELVGGAIALEAIAFLFATLVDQRNSGDPMIAIGWDAYRVGAVQRMNVEVLTKGLVFLAAVWPAFLWRDEGPAQRRYHWSLPADRGWHDLARVAAGAIWIAILTVLAFTAIAVWLPGGRGVTIPARWFVMILLGAYGMGSIAALTTERPLMWILGAIAFGAVASAMLSFARIRDPFEWLDFYGARAGILLWLTVPIFGLGLVTQHRTGAQQLTLRRA
jgi:hypothetical protein